MATVITQIDPSTTHPAFDCYAGKVQMTEDAFNGTVEGYVEILDGMTKDEFKSYVGRGSYFNMVNPTCTAMVGAMTRKPYTLNGETFPETDYQTPDVYLQANLRNILLGGRTFILVTVEDGKSKLVTFAAQDVINWSDSFKVIKQVNLVADPKNYFKQMPQVSYLELYLDNTDKDGKPTPNAGYHSRTWVQQGGKKGKWVATQNPDLLVKGETLLGYIPLYIATPFDTSWELINPPLWPQADINVDHFRMSCDLYHYAHFMALPTMYVSGLRSSGLDPNGNAAAPQRIDVGSTSNVVALDVEGKLGYAEVTGNSFKMLQEEMKNMEGRMIQCGSRLMTTSKNGVESAQALQIRLGNDHATLETVVNSFESALNDALAVCNQIDGTNLTIKLNSDFSAESLDAMTITALLNSVINGVITPLQFVQALIEAELIDPDPTMVDEDGNPIAPMGGAGVAGDGNATRVPNPDHLITPMGVVSA